MADKLKNLLYCFFENRAIKHTSNLVLRHNNVYQFNKLFMISKRSKKELQLITRT